VGQSKNCRGSGGVVVSSVVNCVTVDGRPLAQVIKMCGEEDDFIGRGTAAENSHSAPGFFARGIFKFGETLLKSLRKGIGQRGLLKERAVVAAWLEAEGLKLRGGEERRDVLIASCGSSSVKFIISEKVHIGADFLFE
jgi:hypothetical protein